MATHGFFVTQTFQDLQLPGLLTKEQMQKELDSGKLPKLPPAKKWVRGLFWPATPGTPNPWISMVEMVNNCMPEHQAVRRKYTYLEDVLFEKPRGPRRSV